MVRLGGNGVASRSTCWEIGGEIPDYSGCNSHVERLDIDPTVPVHTKDGGGPSRSMLLRSGMGYVLRVRLYVSGKHRRVSVLGKLLR